MVHPHVTLTARNLDFGLEVTAGAMEYNNKTASCVSIAGTRIQCAQQVYSPPPHHP